MDRKNSLKRNTPKWNIKIPALRLRYRLLLYILTIVFAALSLLNVINAIFPYIIGIICYTLAGCTLFATCYYLVRDICRMREKVKPGVKANPFANRVTTDYRYRTVLFAVPGLILNLFFAIFNGVIGVISLSPWFGSLAAYYILLSVIRFLAIRYDRRVSKLEQTRKLMLEEINVYRNCGILLLVMTSALGGAVILLIHEEGGKYYPGVTIYAVAAYTFYKIIISGINVVKAGKLKSPLLMTIRDIGYVDACVSILSLQTAMFASFGKGQEKFAKQANGITGAVVCLMVLVMGIYIIRAALKMKRGLLEQAGGI